MNLDKKEIDMGIMWVAMNQHGNYASAPVLSFTRKACAWAPDSMLFVHWLIVYLIGFAGTIIEFALGQPLAIRLDCCLWYKNIMYIYKAGHDCTTLQFHSNFWVFRTFGKITVI